MKTSLLPAMALAASLSLAPFAAAQTISPNFGSLGAIADGTTTADAILEVPSPLAAPGDFAIGYAGGARTTIPYLPAINPPAGSPFSIEFWANPTASDNDDAPVANRIASGNRSGWVFFQRNAATGWNFRMYDGVGGNLGWDLTGGTANLNEWSHVVATWDGSAARLYVNGTLADDVNTGGLSNVYNPSTSATFAIGSLFDGGSATTASIDEVAFYGTALTPEQISTHFFAASDLTPGLYSAVILDDAPLVYLQNVPEPSTTVLAALAAISCTYVANRRSLRKK
jgi:hypothetical protein